MSRNHNQICFSRSVGSLLSLMNSSFGSPTKSFLCSAKLSRWRENNKERKTWGGIMILKHLAQPVWCSKTNNNISWILGHEVSQAFNISRESWPPYKADMCSVCSLWHFPGVTLEVAWVQALLWILHFSSFQSCRADDGHQGSCLFKICFSEAMYDWKHKTPLPVYWPCAAVLRLPKLAG